MLAVALVLALACVAGLAVSTDTLGAGRLFDRAVAKVDRFLAGPVPDRSAPATVLVTTPGRSDPPDQLDPDEGGPSESLPAPTSSRVAIRP